MKRCQILSGPQPYYWGVTHSAPPTFFYGGGGLPLAPFPTPVPVRSTRHDTHPAIRRDLSRGRLWRHLMASHDINSYKYRLQRHRHHWSNSRSDNLIKSVMDNICIHIKAQCKNNEHVQLTEPRRILVKGFYDTFWNISDGMNLNMSSIDIHIYICLSVSSPSSQNKFKPKQV